MSIFLNFDKGLNNNHSPFLLGRPMKKRKVKWIWKILAILIVMAILIKAPALLLLFLGTLSVYAVIKRIRRSSNVNLAKEENVHVYKSDGSSLTPLPKITTPRKLKCLYEYKMPFLSRVYLPSKDSPCMILFKGLTLIGIGAIELKSLPKERKASLSGLFSSAMKLGYDITYTAMYEPLPEEQAWRTRIIFIVRTKKLAVRVTSTVVREVVDDVIRRLEWTRSAIISSMGLVDVNVLSGEDLAQAVFGVITG